MPNTQQKIVKHHYQAGDDYIYNDGTKNQHGLTMYSKWIIALLCLFCCIAAFILAIYYSIREFKKDDLTLNVEVEGITIIPFNISTSEIKVDFTLNNMRRGGFHFEDCRAVLLFHNHIISSVFVGAQFDDGKTTKESASFVASPSAYMGVMPFNLQVFAHDFNKSLQFMASCQNSQIGLSFNPMQGIHSYASLFDCCQYPPVIPCEITVARI